METAKLKTFTKWPVNLLVLSCFISDQGKYAVQGRDKMYKGGHFMNREEINKNKQGYF